MADITFQLVSHTALANEDDDLIWEEYVYECGCKRMWIVKTCGTVVELRDYYNCKFHWYIEVL